MKIRIGKRDTLILLGGIAVLVILVGLFQPWVPKDYIKVVGLEGQIITGKDTIFGTSGYITTQGIKGMVEDINRDYNLKGLVIKINSPGGSVAASQEILYELNKVDKPLIFFFEEEVASGGYYIAMSADEIYALPTCLCGSIGVIGSIPDFSGLWEKIGLKFQSIHSGEFKDMYSGNRPLTREETNIIQALVDECYGGFLKVVAEGRGLDTEEVRKFATGQLYSATQALELGMVDKLGYLDDAVEECKTLVGDPSIRVKYEGQGLFGGAFGMAINWLGQLGKVGLNMEYR